MKEKTLKDFFDDVIPATALAKDVIGSNEKTGYDTETVYVEPIEAEEQYFVTRQHLLKLCQAVLNDSITVQDLNTIAFSLMCSDYFIWDLSDDNGKIIETTLLDWDGPELNYPLTKENFMLWKAYLETGEYGLR